MVGGCASATGSALFAALVGRDGDSWATARFAARLAAPGEVVAVGSGAGAPDPPRLATALAATRPTGADFGDLAAVALVLALAAVLAVLAAVLVVVAADFAVLAAVLAVLAAAFVAVFVAFTAGLVAFAASLVAFAALTTVSAAFDAVAGVDTALPVTLADFEGVAPGDDALVALADLPAARPVVADFAALADFAGAVDVFA